MRLLVLLPQVNPNTFLLFTWQDKSDGACLRNYSRGPECNSIEDDSRSAREVRELLNASEAIQVPAEHRSTDDTGYWFAKVDQLNQEHGLPGWVADGTGIARAATHGSRYWIQRYVNEQPETINDLAIGSSPTLSAFMPSVVTWKSPLAKEDYREYRDGFLEAVGLAEHAGERQRFWPKTGPQWDALATIKNDHGEHGVLLVEAKSYPSESYGGGSDANDESRTLIARSLDTVKAYCGVPPETDWMGRAYQTANRLAFLYFLDEVCHVPTWLLFVNFVNDSSHHPTSMAQWAEHCPRLLRELGLHCRAPLLSRTIMVFPDVADGATPKSLP
jgi:hypothetical protein